jgi:polysaccharide export outer membrane protein
MGDAHIVRTSGSGRSRVLVPVNISQIIKGKSPDIPLTSDDILFVPTNKMKAAIKGGGSSLIVSLASAFLYTH